MSLKKNSSPNLKDTMAENRMPFGVNALSLKSHASKINHQVALSVNVYCPFVMNVTPRTEKQSFPEKTR